MRFRTRSLLPLLLAVSFLGLTHSADVSKAQTNHPPVASPDTVQVHGSNMTPSGANALSNDSDPDGDQLQVVYPGPDTTVPDVGRLWVGSSGGIGCTGGKNSGTITVQYSATDGHGGSSGSTVTCENHNQPPIAVMDYYPVTSSNFASRPGEGVLANDTDPDGDTIHGSYQSTALLYDSSGQWQGQYQVLNDGTVIGLFSTNFNGILIGGYTITDDPGAPASGTIFFSVHTKNAAGKSCNSVGKPVNPTNGNMWAEQTDYQLPGIGENIDITRYYNSANQLYGLFGFGWTTQYDESLVLYGDKLARVNMPDGKAAYFYRTNTADDYVNEFNDVRGKISSDGTGYTLTFLDGRTHRFNTAGKLQWQKDRNGNQTTLYYNANGTMNHITDAFGRTLTFTYSTNQFQISDALGVIATYAMFPNSWILQSVTYQDQSKFNFHYDSTTAFNKVLLDQITDANAKVIESHTYDSSGRATTSALQGQIELYTFNYSNIANGVTTVTDQLGRQTTYHFDTDRVSNLVNEIDGICGCGGGGSQVTHFEYDIKGNLTKKTDALNRQTTYTYDASGNRLTQTDPWGTQTFTYNSFGEILTYMDRMNGMWTYTYDSNGNPLTTADPLSHTTTITYPSTNNKGLPDSIQDARQNVTTFTWLTNSDLLDTITDPYGKTTSFTYDVRNRVKTIIDAKGFQTKYDYFDSYVDTGDNQPHSRIEMTYPNLDKIIYRYDKRRLLDRITDERGKITTFNYDDAHRLIKITDPLGHYKQFGYNNMSFMTTYTDPLGKVTTYVPDDFDRLKEIDYPVKGTGYTALKEQFSYDLSGRMVKHTDTTNNRWTQYDYDDANRTITTSIKRGTTETETVSTVAYNQRFQTTDVTDAASQHYQFTYDPLGRVLSKARAGATMTYTYDESENPKTRTDFNGRLTNYTFDKLSRLTKIEYDDGDGNPANNLQSTYVWDEISRLTSATNQTGTVGFTYDSRNRVQTTTDVFGKVLTYEYELTPTVNQQRLKLDGTLYATYNSDDAGNLSNVVDASDSSTISFQYDAEDKLTKRIYQNGITTDYSYFDDDSIKEIKDSTSASTLFDRQYSYLNCVSDNQICQITEPGLTKSFTYDLADRLSTVTASNSQNENYNYGTVGNRSSSHLASSYTYKSGQFNQLATAVGPTQTLSYDYNANGAMTSRTDGTTTWAYTWDFENRMTSASNGTSQVGYAYDALGRRISRNHGTQTANFTYDGDDVLLDDVGGTQTKYINGLGIDSKLRQTTGSTASYFLADHLGSTNGLADSSGNLTASNSYDSFGNATNTSFPTRYQFTGREYDSTTSLHYYRARWYDGSAGRFISEDPMGLSGGANLYGYVGNNPGNFSDPLGLFPTASEIADWYISKINYARQSFKADSQYWYYNAVIDTDADILTGGYDQLKAGNGVGYAAFDEKATPLQRAMAAAQDGLRIIALVTSLGGAAGELATACPTGKVPTARLPGPTVDPVTGEPVGRFVVDPNGNAMIEPVGGRTVPGRNPVDTHTQYPNGSNYQRLNPAGHRGNPTPHGHGHLPGTGPGMRGQGPSLDVNGNVVPWNSPAAHWPINQ